MISPFLMGIYLILSRHFSQRQNSIFVILCPIKGIAKGRFGLAISFSLCVPFFGAKPRKRAVFRAFRRLCPALCLFSLLWPGFLPSVPFFLVLPALALLFARFSFYGLIFHPLRRFPLLSGFSPCFLPVSPPTALFFALCGVFPRFPGSRPCFMSIFPSTA